MKLRKNKIKPTRKTRLDELWEKMFGNGQEGLLVRVTRIEDKQRIIITGIGAILILVIKQVIFNG